ncbi:MAG: orotate phosphoribosyltransferase [bacterium]
MTSEQVFQSFRDTKALLSGHFELRSGLHSDQFFQCALVLQYPRVAEMLCAAMVESMRKSVGASYRPDAVISPAMGGILVGQEVGRVFDVRTIFVEKQDNKLVLRRGFEIKPGQHFVVAEDVMTRGGRIQETIDIVRGRGGMVDAVLVLVDRSGGKAKFDVPVHSLLPWEPVTWQPAECPLCKRGVAVEHPGS